MKESFNIPLHRDMYLSMWAPAHTYTCYHTLYIIYTQINKIKVVPII